ncbi:MAG TPA: alpha/beta fold hydrolase [Bauldia sp.]|nr:alpha/beta fold hydrolase [Bauldia sp.]
MTVVPLNVMRWGDPGAARTVVALHGITANAGAWTRPGRRLAAAGWHVIATDMRGHGESGRGDGDFSFDALLGDIAAAVPAEPDVLIGHSFGGTLAQLGVLAGLFRPKALILEDPVSHFADRETPTGMLAWDEANLPRDVPGLLELNPGWAPIDAAWKVVSLFQIDFADARAAFAGNAPFDLRPKAAGIAAKVPTVWVLPDVSRFVPAEDQARLRDEVGERSMLVVPGVGHSVHRDALEPFCDLVIKLGEGRWFDR